MFNYRSILVLILITNLSFGQAQQCNEFSVLEKALNILLQSTKDTVVIEFSNALSAFTMSDIKAVTDFTDYEIDLIKTKLSNKWDYHLCTDISDLIIQFQVKSPLSKNKTYTLRNYSQPIFLNENKAVLLLSFAVKSKVYIGGKAIGSEILEIYERKGGKWKRTARKALSVS
jgi:hypothetical protein